VVSGAPGPYVYAWTPQAGLSDASAPTPCALPDSTTPYTLVVTAANGCSSDPTDTSAVATVTVLDTAEVDFGSVPGPQVQLFLPNAFVEFSNQTQGGATFHWDFGDGLDAGGLHAAHSYGQPGAYFVTLTATTAQGCISRITQGPYVVLPSDLFIPNVFSPNGDGVHDVYLVNYVGGMPFTLQITDRWGVALFASSNPALGWNGQNGQGIDVPEGVYFYVVTVVGMGRHVGTVTLVR
jgi:gliding motility-associated-like protein